MKGTIMASITIRNLDDDVKTRLRVRAASNGRSMEEEARLILRDAFGVQEASSESRERHSRPDRTSRRRGPGVAPARARTRAAVLRLRRHPCSCWTRT